MCPVHNWQSLPCTTPGCRGVEHAEPGSLLETLTLVDEPHYPSRPVSMMPVPPRGIEYWSGPLGMLLGEGIRNLYLTKRLSPFGKIVTGLAVAGGAAAGVYLWLVFVAEWPRSFDEVHVEEDSDSD